MKIIFLTNIKFNAFFLVNADKFKWYVSHNTNFLQKKCVKHICCHKIPKWKPSSQLLQSYLKAHRLSCLVLLRSSSDTVRRDLLFKTLLSTPLAQRNLPYLVSKNAFNPAIVDLGLQGTTSSPSSLTRVYYNILIKKCK